MRKLKLEIQLSLDGFCADSKGKTDWMVWNWQPTWNWDKKLQDFHTRLQTSSSTILMSGRAGESFFDHWETVASDTKSSQYKFANAINKMDKLIISKKMKVAPRENATIVKDNLVTEVNRLKRSKGKDIIVSGGARFVSSLIKEDLVDEYNLIINPVILGNGKPIFKQVAKKRNLELKKIDHYKDGMITMIFTRTL